MHTDSSNSQAYSHQSHHSDPKTASKTSTKTATDSPSLRNKKTYGSAASNLSHHSNSLNCKNLSYSPHKVEDMVSLKVSDTNLIPMDGLPYAAINSSDKVKINKMVKIRTRTSESADRYETPTTTDTKSQSEEKKEEKKTNTIIESPPMNASKKSISLNKPARNSVLGLLSLNNIAESTDEDMAENRCLRENGYAKVEKLCDTLQGELFEAITLDESKNVVIKKTDKTLHDKRISIQQGMSIVVEENIIKEAIILHHLTVDNKPTSDYIAKFIKFFESDNAFYLVMEKAGNTNLAEFTKQAHKYIDEKKLKLKEWKKIVKYLFWQLAVIMFWLHHDMKCCHLDLNLTNIVLQHGTFIEKKNGEMAINPNIKIKLVDFGLAEIFKSEGYDHNRLSDSLEPLMEKVQKMAEELHAENKENKDDDAEDEDEDPDDEYYGNDFKCTKHGITDKHYLQAPRVFFEDAYDAKKADIWSMGIILYQLATGLEPYKSPDIKDNCYYKVKHGKLVELITMQEKTKHVNQKMVNLMKCMLNVREEDRFDSVDVIRNEWLTLYYSKYKSQIKKKSQTQIARNQKLARKMGIFPYYKCVD